MHLNEKKDKLENQNKKRNKLPFAVFITPINKEKGNVGDYKEIFTDIISDRIQEKFK